MLKMEEEYIIEDNYGYYIVFKSFSKLGRNKNFKCM